MAGQTSWPNLAGWRHGNWGGDLNDAPVVFNDAASTHACVAWAWGAASEALSVMHAASILDPDGDEPGELYEVAKARVMAVVVVLDKLAERTNPHRQAQSAGRR